MQDQWLYREVVRRLAHMGINIDVPPHDKPSVSRAMLQLALEAVQSHMDTVNSNFALARSLSGAQTILDSQEKHVPMVCVVIAHYGELYTGREYYFLTSANTEDDAKAKVMREIDLMGLAKSNWLCVINWSDLCKGSNTKEAVFLYERT